MNLKIIFLIFGVLTTFSLNGQEEIKLKEKTHSFAVFSEIQSIRYHNFHFEPLLLYFSGGIHHNIDLISSGKNYAIGINQSFTFANSLQTKNVFFVEYFLYLYSRAGYVDKNEDNSIITLRAGAGPNLYRNYEQMNKFKMILVPSYFFEVILNMGRPILFRYHRSFFHRDRTKEGYQLGFVFPL